MTKCTLIVTVSQCQSTISQNCTYWQNPGFSTTYAASGQCRVYIQQCDPSVCQVRLDFLSFTLAQPNSDGLCTNDLFTVTGTSNNIPTICGYNTGQHSKSIIHQLRTEIMNQSITSVFGSDTWNWVTSVVHHHDWNGHIAFMEHQNHSASLLHFLQR